MKTNKLLSVVLTLCVLLAAFSLTALAADDVTTVKNLEALTAALAAGGEVRLDADITSVGAPVTVPAGVTASLDLNGHTLMVSKYTAEKDQVLVKGSLTLTDSVGTGKVCSDFTGTSGRVVSVLENGSLQLAGGTITTEGMEKNGSAVYVGGSGSFTLTGGTVYADAKRNNNAVNLVNAKASMEMSGGTITAIPTADSDDDVYAISAAYSPVKISAGTVSGHPAMSVGNGSAITGGVYNGVVKAKAGTISGGTFTTDVTDYLADENVKICEKQADGTYQVLTAAYAAAKIIAADGTATRYGSFAGAVAALKDGDTLVMLDDIGTAAEPRAYGIVVTANNVTLNMNGKVLTVGYDAAAATAAGVPGYAAGVGIVNGGSGLLTVSGDGTVDVSNYTGTDGIAVWARTGSITVQSGTFINKSNEEATVYVGTNDGSSPVLKIAGGTYKNIAEGNYKYDESRTPLTFNIYNGKTAAALKISGGDFYGNNDPYLGDDQVKGRILTYATTGVRKNDGYYRVAAGQAIQLLDANGGAKDCSTDVSKIFAGAADGDTLVLLKNTSVSKQLNVTKAVTIDLGGYTLTNSYAPSGKSYSLLTRAAVTMKNGTYKSTKASAWGIGAVADFTLEKATVSAAGLVGLGCSAADATYTVKNSTVIGNYALANFANNAKINIEDSTITGKDVGIYNNGSNSGLKLTATGSTITAAATGATNGIYVSGSTDTMAAAGTQQVTLTNCTVSGDTAVEVKYTDLTLTNCKVTATAETPSYTQDDNGAATTGFAVVSTDNTTGAATPAPKGTITIQGANGSYKGQVGLASLETVKTDYADFKDTTYAVSGGSFTKEVLPEYCAAGFIPTKNADDTYGVKAAPVAKIGTVEYATFADAIAAAKGGDTVTLLCDVTENDKAGAQILYNLTGVTLDLGGYTYTQKNLAHVFLGTGGVIKNGKMVCDNGSYALFIGDEGETTSFTVDGVEMVGGINIYNASGVVLKNLTVNGTNYYAVWMDEGASATIESGTYNAGDVAVLGSGDKSELHVTGGTFCANEQKLVSANKNGVVAVSGGSFTKEVLPEYCAAGFIPTKNADDTYGVKAAPVAKIGTVEYATLNEAFAAAKDGDTITIVRNFTTDETKTTAADRATVKANVTLDFGSYVMTVPASLEPTDNFMAILVDGSTLTVEGTTGGIVSGDAETCGVYGFNVKGGGKLVINGGSYYCGITVAQAQLGAIEVNGGSFAVNDANGKYPGYMFNCVDANYAAGTAGITVSGGTFVGYDPRNNTAEGKGTSFVAEGVGINKDENGSFTAVPNMAAQIVDADGNSVAAYTGHYDAIAAAKDGEKVILLSDRKNFVTNTIDANITIDLNGKTLSVGNNNPFFRTNGEVTIQNGTIDSQDACVIVNAYNKLTLKNVKITGVTGNDGKNLVNVCRNAEVTIDKDTVLTASGSNGAVVFIGQDADAKYTLNVYGKVIRESKSFAISGNGSYKGTTTINIYDGAEVKSASVAIYHPQAGVINVNGGLVEGYCAIGIKSGTLNISGGTVRGTANDHALDDSNSTSGTIIYDGSAIIVDSRSTGYAGNVNINVTGGTVESRYSTAIREIGEQDKPNMTQLTKLNITGGSVRGASQQLGNVTNDMLVRDISSSNVSVSGGTFNHAVPETYCADGFVPAVNKDGTYTVAEKAENPFGKSFSVVNKPVMTQNGVDYYTVVVYSGIDSLNYKKAGFAYRMEATKKNNETVKAQDVRETTTAYKAISGTNNQGKTYTYTAEQIGAAYIYGQRFLFPVSDYTSANTALYVTPYVVTLDGKTIYGDEIELTETALSAKGSHLFWQGQ